MLSSHSLVKSIPETSFIRRYLVNKFLSKLYKNKGLTVTLHHLIKDIKLQRLNINYNDFLK